MLIEIAFKLLRPSALNPRKHFDAEAVADLAESVATKGVLQNLVVREGADTTGPGTYEIVAGERRWRAVRLLVEAGRLTEDYAIPANVMPSCDDVELLKLATAENVSRASMTPLEEADAFHRLAEAGVGTDEMAALSSKTRRWVQLRLSLVEKAVPEVRAALEDGRINVKQAEAFATAPRDRQTATLAKLVERPDWFRTAAAVKQALRQDMIAAAHALFPPSAYRGETVTDDDTGETFLADATQFWRLQEAAIKAEAKRQREENHAAFVRQYDRRKGEYFASWDWPEAPAGHAKAGTIIIIVETGAVEIKENRIARDNPPKPAGGAGVPPATDPDAVPAPTKAHLIACRQARTQMLQTAVAGLPPVAMRLAILGLLGADQVKIGGQPKEADDRALSPEVRDILAGFAERYPAVLHMAETGGDATTSGRCSGPLTIRPNGIHIADGQRQAEAWQVLAEMPETDVSDLFAALVAERFGSFSGYSTDYGDQALPAAVAAALMVQPSDWRPTEDFLKTLRKPQLVRLAEAVEVMTAPGIPRRTALQALKTAELITDILGAWDTRTTATAVLPTLRFGSPAEVEKAVLAWLDPKSAESKRKQKKKEAA